MGRLVRRAGSKLSLNRALDSRVRNVRALMLRAATARRARCLRRHDRWSSIDVYRACVAMTEHSRSGSSTAAREVEFIGRIDCSFPYADEHQRRLLFAEAASISANAEMMTLRELLCAPASVSVSDELQAQMLDEWRAASRCPRCLEFAALAATKREPNAISRNAVDQLVAIARQLPNAFNAISILEWFAEGVWSDAEADEHRSRIQCEWKR
jgi:hypothetical protein